MIYIDPVIRAVRSDLDMRSPVEVLINSHVERVGVSFGLTYISDGVIFVYLGADVSKQSYFSRTVRAGIATERSLSIDCDTCLQAASEYSGEKDSGAVKPFLKFEAVPDTNPARSVGTYTVCVAGIQQWQVALRIRHGSLLIRTLGTEERERLIPLLPLTEQLVKTRIRSRDLY